MEIDKIRAAVQPVIEKSSVNIGPDFVKAFYSEVDWCESRCLPFIHFCTNRENCLHLFMADPMTQGYRPGSKSNLYHDLNLGKRSQNSRQIQRYPNHRHPYSLFDWL